MQTNNKKKLQPYSHETRIEKLEQADRSQSIFNFCVGITFFLLLISDLIGHGFIQKNHKKYTEDNIRETQHLVFDTVCWRCNNSNQKQ